MNGVRGLAVTGLIATLGAMAATAVVAALARAVGVDFAVSNSDETIPVSGIAVVTGFFSVVGVVLAAALLRWSARPAEWFVRTAVTLAAISLVPPVLLGADAATATALVGLHVIAATVMIPTLTRSLGSSRTVSIQRLIGRASHEPGCGDRGAAVVALARDRRGLLVLGAEAERDGEQEVPAGQVVGRGFVTGAGRPPQPPEDGQAVKTVS